MLTVSLCVVAYNEETYLPNLLQDIQAQTFDHSIMQVLLIDSMSTDKTHSIMVAFKVDNLDFQKVKIIINEKKIQAAGWNKAILHTETDVLIRIDAHAKIPDNFVAKCMKNIESGEYITGGIRPCLIQYKNKWSEMLLAVESSAFGSNVNACRKSSKRQFVKTLFHGAYRIEVFKKAGGFNENLARTEDNEIHYRIRQAGYNICLDPDIVSYQYARNNLRCMIKQKYGNGYWIGLTLGICPKCISLFHLVPLAFVFGILLTTFLCCLGFWILSAYMWTAYFSITVIIDIKTIRDNGFNPYLLIMPFIFLILHISYGAGTLVGFIRMPFKRKALAICPARDKIKEKLFDK